MNTEQAEKKVVQAQALLDEAINNWEEIKKKTEHKPQEGRYWMDAVGVIECDFSNNPNKSYVAYYNQFNKEHVAKIAALRNKISNCLTQAADELCPEFVPDYKSRNQVKCVPIYNHTNKIVTAGVRYETQLFNLPAFDTTQNAIAAGERALPYLIELNELVGE